MSEKLSNTEATEILEGWADFMELDTERDMYQDVVETLRMPVKLNKLTFDEATETFSLVLRNKVKDKSMVEIKSCDMAAKRVLQKFKDHESIDTARAMLAAYTDLEESDVRLLKDLDVNRINAIIMGFITQIDPKK